MTGKRVALSAVDFLGLAKTLRTEFVSFEAAGRAGGVWIRELTEAEKRKVMAMSGKVRTFGDGSVELDMASMPKQATAKILEMALVTDESGTVQMFDAITKEVGSIHQAREQMDALPAKVADIIVKTVRKLSGMDDADTDAVEEKKENS